MAIDMSRLALMVRAASGPAPTLSTKNNPVATANEPMIPPSGAHQGMLAIACAVGNGRGCVARTMMKNARVCDAVSLRRIRNLHARLAAPAMGVFQRDGALPVSFPDTWCPFF